LKYKAKGNTRTYGWKKGCTAKTCRQPKDDKNQQKKYPNTRYYHGEVCDPRRGVSCVRENVWGQVANQTVGIKTVQGPIRKPRPEV